MNETKLWVSSVDSDRLSLTVRGLLVGLIPLLSIAFGVPAEAFNGVAEGIISLITSLLGLLSVGMTLYGATRKLVNTIKK